MSKKAKVWLGICMLCVAIIVAGHFFRFDRFGMSKISWVDCIQINNVKYYGDFEKTTVDPSLIGKYIGKVKFNVSKNVNNSDYRFRNGDATFLDKGTKIYSLKANADSIAAKVGEKYFIYENDKYDK